MWKPEKDARPYYNELNHLKVDNISFVTNLRSSVEKPAKKLDIPKVTTEKKKDKFAIKETYCSNRECLSEDIIYRENHYERKLLLEKIDELTTLLIADESNLTKLITKYESCIEKQHEFDEKINNLTLAELDLKPKVVELRHEAKRLEKEIRKAELRNDNIKQAAQYRDIVDGIVFDFEKKDNSIPFKHNGVYALTSDGVSYAWTCCLSTDEHGEGCIDDCSVDIRSTLPLVKNYYNNQVSIDHPLQHGSLLFIENSAKLQYTPSTSIAVSPSLFNKSEYSSNNNNNDKSTDRLLITNKAAVATTTATMKHSTSVDYFSVHKPATRVEAMIPYSNKSIRNTKELKYGVPGININCSSSYNNNSSSSSNNHLKHNSHRANESHKLEAGNAFVNNNKINNTTDSSRPSSASMVVQQYQPAYSHMDPLVRTQIAQMRAAVQQQQLLCNKSSNYQHSVCSRRTASATTAVSSSAATPTTTTTTTTLLPPAASSFIAAVSSNETIHPQHHSSLYSAALRQPQQQQRPQSSYAQSTNNPNNSTFNILKQQQQSLLTTGTIAATSRRPHTANPKLSNITAATTNTATATAAADSIRDRISAHHHLHAVASQGLTGQESIYNQHNLLYAQPQNLLQNQSQQQQPHYVVLRKPDYRAVSASSIGKVRTSNDRFCLTHNNRPLTSTDYDIYAPTTTIYNNNNTT